jgi:outer membrane immunogenic protein
VVFSPHARRNGDNKTLRGTYLRAAELSSFEFRTGEGEMKKTLIAAFLGATFSSAAAFAADMPPAMPYKAAPANLFSWEGYYFGVHGGYGWGDHRSVATNDVTLEPSGGFGGVQAGYNSMIAPNWLLGSEIQISGGDIDDNIGVPGNTIRSKINFFGTALARFGYTFDRTLIYVAGGAAWARVKADDATGQFRITESHGGWAIGGGLEYAFDSRWSAKIEYLYASLDNLRIATSGGDNYRGDLSKFSTVKFGVNYRFGEPASAAAMPVKAMPRAAYSWAGSYIGGNVGYLWGHTTVSNPVLGGSTTVDARDWNHGIQTGYNWVFAPNLLLGFETDNALLNVEGNDAGASVKVTNASTVRARLGYFSDRTLVYATGGLAIAKEKFNDPPNGQIVNGYQIGWVAGGGVEYMFAPRWSTKLEYLYADYGHTNLDLPNIGDGNHSSLKMQSVTLGLNYKFDLAELLRR